MARATEDDIAVGVMMIAHSVHGGVATFPRLKRDLPHAVKFSEEDWAISDTRPNEPMWHQILRNIKSHHTAEGNAIREGYLIHIPRVGYQVTDAGRNYAAKRIAR